jgi:hypothetical protein
MRRFVKRSDIGIIAGCIFVFALFSLWNPQQWFNWGTISNIGQYTAVLGLLAIGQLSVRERAHVNELAVQLKQQGLLVIYITHDIFQIHRIADRIVIMENGRKVTDVPRDAMSAEALEGIIRDGRRRKDQKLHEPFH